MMRKMGLILGMVFVLVGVSLAASPTATYLIQRLQYVEQLTGIPQSFIAARMMTPEQVDSIWGIDTDSTAWQSRANAFLGRNTFAAPGIFADTVHLNGHVRLGDSAADVVRAYGQILTYSMNGTSNWVTIKDPASMVRGSYWHSAAKLTGMAGATQWNQLFVNAQMDTAHATASIRGAEIKGTANATLSGTSQLMGLYAKTTVKSPSTVAFSTPVYSLLGTETGGTTTMGHNFYAENSVQGTCTASDILGIHPTNNTWTYGFDLNGATFGTADMRLANGATIANASAATLTITETNIALAGAVTATTAAVGSSGSVLTKAWVTGTGASDSLLFIVGNDTFVATQVRVGH